MRGLAEVLAQRGEERRKSERRSSKRGVRCRFPVAVGLLCMLCVTGCRGGGDVQLISLDFRSIDPPAPRVFELSFDRCVWWSDANGRLWLAMSRDMQSILGPLGRVQFEMSIRLEKPPSGKARNYSLAADEVRARIRTALSETRLTSISGILAVYRESGDALRGSFRFQANRHTLQILGGWSRGARFLFLGRFHAAPDAGEAAAIVESTEGPGFERGEPTSAPAVQTARAPAAHE